MKAGRTRRLRTKLDPNVVVGIDQSARGTAAVVLKNGSHRGQIFYTLTKGQAKKMADFGALLPAEAKAGDESARVARLDRIVRDVGGFIDRCKPGHVALEEHGFVRGQAHVRTLAEVGGVLRLMLWRRGIPFRTYPPEVIKIHATGSGSADKDEMILAARERPDLDGIDFMALGGKQEVAGNLADAYAIAHLLWTELRLRSADLRLSDVDVDRRRVFLRTTKQHPVNLLDIPFAVRETGQSASTGG